MPIVAKPVAIPNPKTWSRALRRYDRDPRLPMRYASYDANINAKVIDVNGTIALTLFFPKGKEVSAARATRLGWIDETESVLAAFHGSDAFAVLIGSEAEAFVETLDYRELGQLAKVLNLPPRAPRPKLVERILAAIASRGGLKSWEFEFADSDEEDDAVEPDNEQEAV